MHKLHRKFLLKNGWFLNKEYPLYITHENGSVASGTAAESIIRKLNFPEVLVQWYHPILDITCEELLLDADKPQNYEHVWQPHPTLPYGEKMTLKPYYDNVRIGDYWVVNGHWWGRKEEKGFRVLATHDLVECDNTLWKRKERLVEKYFEEDDEDFIAF